MRGRLQCAMTVILTTPQAYDSHCNLVLGEVEETIYTIEEEDDGDETVKVGSVKSIDAATDSDRSRL